MSKLQTIKLSDMFTLQMGKTPSRDNPAYWNGTHKWVSIADLGKATKFIVDTKECITDLAVSETGIRATPKDTVVMSFKLSIGKTAVTAEEIYTNEAIMSFVDKGIYDFDIDYIYHLFSGKDWSEGTNKAVMGVTLNKATLSQISIPLPPIEEQRKIAHNLEKVTYLIEVCNTILEKLDLLVKSRFVEMFGGITERRKLEEYADLITKGASPKWQGIDYAEEGTLFVTSENVREGYLDFTKKKYLPNDINKILPRSVLKRNDILINIVNASIGRVAVYDSDELANINQAVALVRLKPNVLNTSFLLTFLNSDEALKAYDFMKVGGDKANLSLKNISDLLIPVADLELQNQFAAFVEQTDKSKLAVKQVLEKAETLKKALMQEYFG